MFSVEQSAFLNALGYALGNSVWQLGCLWLLYMIITRILTLSASRKYELATTLTFLGFFWFIATFGMHYAAILQHADIPAHEFDISLATDTNAKIFSFTDQLQQMYRSALNILKDLSPYISCAYLLVFLTLGIRLINGFRQVHVFATQGLGEADQQWRTFTKRCAALLHIRQDVQILTSLYVQSPLTIGFWKPIILLPVASLNNLTTQQVEAVLLHELAHIRRHDYIVNIFLQIIEVFLFFNPFVRLLLRHIREERENCCDDYVLQFQYDAKDYAKALLIIERNNTALLALHAKSNHSFQLLQRVKRMLAPKMHTFSYKQQLYMLFAITILGFGFTFVSPSVSFKALTSQKNVSIEYAASAGQHGLPVLRLSFAVVKNLSNEKVAVALSTAERYTDIKSLKKESSYLTKGECEHEINHFVKKENNIDLNHSLDENVMYHKKPESYDQKYAWKKNWKEKVDSVFLSVTDFVKMDGTALEMELNESIKSIKHFHNEISALSEHKQFLSAGVIQKHFLKKVQQEAAAYRKLAWQQMEQARAEMHAAKERTARIVRMHTAEARKIQSAVRLVKNQCEQLKNKRRLFAFTMNNNDVSFDTQKISDKPDDDQQASEKKTIYSIRVKANQVYIDAVSPAEAF